MKKFTINILHNPPVYLIEMGLDEVRSFEVSVQAENKKDAVKYFTALGYPCDESWIN